MRLNQASDRAAESMARRAAARATRLEISVSLVSSANRELSDS